MQKKIQDEGNKVVRVDGEDVREMRFPELESRLPHWRALHEDSTIECDLETGQVKMTKVEASPEVIEPKWSEDDLKAAKVDPCWNRGDVRRRHARFGTVDLSPRSRAMYDRWSYEPKGRFLLGKSAMGSVANQAGGRRLPMTMLDACLTMVATEIFSNQGHEICRRTPQILSRESYEKQCRNRGIDLPRRWRGAFEETWHLKNTHWVKKARSSLSMKISMSNGSIHWDHRYTRQILESLLSQPNWEDQVMRESSSRWVTNMHPVTRQIYVEISPKRFRAIQRYFKLMLSKKVTKRTGVKPSSPQKHLITLVDRKEFLRWCKVMFPNSAQEGSSQRRSFRGRTLLRSFTEGVRGGARRLQVDGMCGIVTTKANRYFRQRYRLLKVKDFIKQMGIQEEESFARDNARFKEKKAGINPVKAEGRRKDRENLKAYRSSNSVKDDGGNLV